MPCHMPLDELDHVAHSTVYVIFPALHAIDACKHIVVNAHRASQGCSACHMTAMSFPSIVHATQATSRVVAHLIAGADCECRSFQRDSLGVYHS